ncbi:uncharacterized protein TRUGW13939_07406 [Talaromyces rugulosus]|uniref:Extracellular membrane protein CFEM domain-containing protein n=1 Tax=Talaromyces rugulosus TaxID=121627 RepID=A0A7H8R606_TALRU|nr:uncharacterized protein TRUGW13939_07406 [Talaromyces rugulosus]QKX60263.1 hypothetical protein TRUGW13939_07406 [Talaromyces rugulosus]
MSAVTTSLSSVVSTTATASIPTHSCAVTYEIPTQDAACGAVHSDISDKIMKQCCGDADIVSIDGGCASYCLAQGKDVGELSKCLYSNGFTGNSVYCNKPQTATATGTGTGTGTATSTGSSGSTATGTAATTTTTGTATTSGTGTATGTSATASTTTGAAVPVAKVSTGGVGVLALLFCSALFGAMA